MEDVPLRRVNERGAQRALGCHVTARKYHSQHVLVGYHMEHGAAGTMQRSVMIWFPLRNLLWVGIRQMSY